MPPNLCTSVQSVGVFRRRVWHPCHTHAALRIPSAEPTPSLFAQVLPQNSQNSQKLQAEDILPRISQNTQKLLAEDIFPRISQMYTDFSSPPVVSVCSVNSVGRYFCGCVGMAGMPYPPNLCTSVQSVGVFVGGYGIPAIPTPPSEFLPQNPFQVCLRKSSHRIHGIHRNFRRRIFSHGFYRCSRIFRLRFAS